MMQSAAWLEFRSDERYFCHVMTAATSPRLLMQAINLYDSINIKAARALVSGNVVDTSPQEMVVQYGDEGFLFVYRFGCLVFFNLPEARVESETAAIKAAMGPGLDLPTTETYQIALGPTNKVEFEHVELKKLSIDSLRLAAVTVGQSAALEYFEIRAERMLHDMAGEMKRFAKSGRVPTYTRKLLRTIGSTASARQHIISNLAILDPPEETWKSKELEKLYKELNQNFDIDTRFKVLDRKLSLVQDNIEILADLTSKSRATILEALIVLLIVLEIVLAMAEKV